jgi:RecJ-like exonuclease
VEDKGVSPTHRKEYSIDGRKLLQATNMKRYTKQLRAQQTKYFYSTKHCACDLHPQERVCDGEGEDKVKEDRWLCFGKSRIAIWNKCTKVVQKKSSQKTRAEGCSETIKLLPTYATSKPQTSLKKNLGLVMKVHCQTDTF